MTTSMVHGASALAHAVGVRMRIVRLIIVIMSNSMRVLHKFAQGLVAFIPLDLALAVGEQAVQGRSPEGAHLVERNVHDLPLLSGVVDVVGFNCLSLSESLELIHLAAQGPASGEWVRRLDLVNQDSVLVDLSHVVGLLQVVPRNLVVRGDVVATSQATDSQVNVRNARVHVHEHDVIVENVDVHHEQAHLRQEGDE